MAAWVYGVGMAPWGSILEPQPGWGGGMPISQMGKRRLASLGVLP